MQPPPPPLPQAEDVRVSQMPSDEDYEHQFLEGLPSLPQQPLSFADGLGGLSAGGYPERLNEGLPPLPHQQPPSFADGFGGLSAGGYPGGLIEGLPPLPPEKKANGVRSGSGGGGAMKKKKSLAESSRRSKVSPYLPTILLFIISLNNILTSPLIIYRISHAYTQA